MSPALALHPSMLVPGLLPHAARIVRWHAAKSPLPPQSGLLTFDDACAAFTRFALPALEREGS